MTRVSVAKSWRVLRADRQVAASISPWVFVAAESAFLRGAGYCLRIVAIFERVGGAFAPALAFRPLLGIGGLSALLNGHRH